jgi:hypothetical protein
MTMTTTSLRSLQEIVVNTGAFKPPTYIPVYERLLEPMRREPLALLELGVKDGGSIKAWEAYFPLARIAGIDLSVPALSVSDRVRLFAGDQADFIVLDRAAAEVAPNGFDIVIDDCAHVGRLAKASFWHLFEHHLKPGGLYCIEDWGTGYWPDWPDGRSPVVGPDSERRLPSHDAGMVGFIKQLVDEISAADIAPGRPSKFSEMQLFPGMCVVWKAKGHKA